VSIPSPEPPRAEAGAAHRSGRLIWTGSLAKRGVLEIEGGSVSVGTVTGGLPGMPLSLKISPAEFGDDGLVVYTSDASRDAHLEPATKANGWNALHYVWNPERARQLAILEAPNPSNQFSRLVLRNDARHCSLILIEWTVP
jgi:hypothetical protein